MSRPSLGLILGLPAGALIVLVLIVAGFLVLRDELGMAVGAWFVAAVVAVATGLLMWPWVGEYHRWTTVTGTVTEVSSRLLASDTQGGGTTQRFVVNLAGIGQRSCDDTRCATVKVGDRLTVSCKRAWQWAGTPGWDCAYVDDQR